MNGYVFTSKYVSLPQKSPHKKSQNQISPNYKKSPTSRSKKECMHTGHKHILYISLKLQKSVSRNINPLHHESLQSHLIANQKLQTRVHLHVKHLTHHSQPCRSQGLRLRRFKLSLRQFFAIRRVYQSQSLSIVVENELVRRVKAGVVQQVIMIRKGRLHPAK